MIKRCLIRVTGNVQGVGFRSYIYHLAQTLSLSGWVKHDTSGVIMEVEGEEMALEDFSQHMMAGGPLLARVDSMVRSALPPIGEEGFAIVLSDEDAANALIIPDIALCDSCRKELLDRKDRRFQYPFINCGNCGPRFTIVRDLPYHRKDTAMSPFPMCARCREECDEPLDRHFQNQTNACPDCGPQVFFSDSQGDNLIQKEAAIQMAVKHLQDGKIIAVKSLGCWHLVCDAANEKAVGVLRQYKQDSTQAFPVMAKNLGVARQYCRISFPAASLLQSEGAPIVLLEKKEGALPEALTLQRHYQSVMLPHTPVQHLLMEHIPLLVMAEVNEATVVYRDCDAYAALSSLVSGFLGNNQALCRPMADSVLTICRKKPYFLRRARGYVPMTLPMPFTAPSILAMGGHQKSTFCLTRGENAFLSQYLGNLVNRDAQKNYRQEIGAWQKLFNITPQVVAYEDNPTYASSHMALARREQKFRVRHHHAHLAACMAEHELDPFENIIGIVYDGGAYGVDGAIWGGEVCVGTYTAIERSYHLPYQPMLGGEAVVLQPWRMALAWAKNMWGEKWPSYLPDFAKTLPCDIQEIWDEHMPLTSSFERFLDGVAALLIGCYTIDFPGQGLLEMEKILDENEKDSWPFGLTEEGPDLLPTWKAMALDIKDGVKKAKLVARFLNTVVAFTQAMCLKLRHEIKIETVALSGDVFQNVFFTEKLAAALEKSGFSVLLHEKTPPNDGCLSYGQAVVAGTYLRDR